VFKTGQRLLSEALSALGFKDEHTRTMEKIPVVMNTLPWPRSAVVPVSTDSDVAIQHSKDKQYALVRAGALATDPIVWSGAQIKAINQGRARSISQSNHAD
jgi:hypothetical protein